MGRVAPYILFGLAYFAACALAIATSRIGGGVALVWIATALLAAKLSVVPAASHRAYLLAAGAASFMATGTLGLGWQAAAPLALVNMAEGYIAAMILLRVERRMGGEAPDLIGRAFLISSLAPLFTVLPGALIATWVTQVAFIESVKNWLIGHVLGYLVLGPMFAMCLRGNLSSWFSDLLTLRRRPAAAALLLVGVTSAACFAQTTMPLLFLPTLTLVVLTYFAGREGAAVGIVMVGIIGGIQTLHGFGPVSLMEETPTFRLQFFEFYLAMNCLAMLPVSAALAARDRLMVQLTQSESRYRLLSNNVTDIVLATTPAGIIRFISPSVRNYGPFTPDELQGRSALDLISPEFHEIIRHAQQRTLRAGGEPVQVEYVGMTGDGKRRWFETVQRCLYDDDGRPIEVVGTVREVSARKALESQLSITAQTDLLTGLPNRRALVEAVEMSLAGGEGGAMALLDLDHFKQLNDRFGHQVGDIALRHFAQIAASCLRGSDVLARWGGEEFAVLLPGASTAQASIICQRLIDTVAEAKLVCADTVISLTVSVGISPLVRDFDLAMRSADQALYRSKSEGRARLSIAA